MQKIPGDIEAVFSGRMKKAGIDVLLQREYRKWLQYYLDFCRKYHHSPDDSDSPGKFMLKLNEKGQAPGSQKRAADSIRVYLDILAKKSSPNMRGTEARRPPSEIPISLQAASCWPGIFRRLKEEIRVRNYSEKTYQAYATWIDRFAADSGRKNPETVGIEDVKRFLTDLAVHQHVAATTQNQAFNALLFLFRHILKRPEDFDVKSGVVRAKRKRYIPVVLSRPEIDLVISKLRPPYGLIAKLLYGCGLRLFEALNLRLHCLDFAEGIVTIHDGKGLKDRTLPLPRTIIPELESHIEQVRELHAKDLNAGFDGVFLPHGAGRKFRSQATEFPWQWLFPAKMLTLVPETGEHKRFHLHETHVQKAIRMAAKRSRLTKRVTAHTFRHSFASHLLMANYDIRTIQKMMGHADVRTTMIYTNTVRSRTLTEQRSPLDFDQPLQD
jgi:integron integrase